MCTYMYTHSTLLTLGSRHDKHVNLSVMDSEDEVTTIYYLDMINVC